MMKNVTQVVEELKAFGLSDSEITINIEKGLKADASGVVRYNDDRKAAAIDDTKFKSVMDTIMGAVKAPEVDMAKSATAVVAKVTRAASGVEPEKVTNEEIKSLLEVAIQKSDTVMVLLQRAIPGLAELARMQVEGVQTLEKSQTGQFAAFTETLKNTRIMPVAAGAKAVHTAPKKAADDRQIEDDGDSFDIWKSQVSMKVHAEANSPDTDPSRRQKIGASAALLPGLRDVPSIKRIAIDLGYTDLAKGAPQAA